MENNTIRLLKLLKIFMKNVNLISQFGKGGFIKKLVSSNQTAKAITADVNGRKILMILPVSVNCQIKTEFKHNNH